MIRWYEPRDEKAVRAIYATCHPTWPERVDHWFHAFPTLVYVPLVTVIGYASFTLSPMPDGMTAYYFDVGILPDWQGRGFGSELFTERERLAQSLGAVRFVGMAAPHNDAMNHLFTARGYAAKDELPEGYPDGPGVLWMKET